jgi:peroxiredoxin Q/BCP
MSTAKVTERVQMRYRYCVMEINEKAPTFTLPDENGNPVSLEQFRGSNVLLFFYPRADTPGCTIEACGFRDTYAKLKKAGVVVLGISPDTQKAQLKFKEKFDLPYTLLADDKKEVAKKFDVLKEKNMYGKKVIGIVRTTFLIGPDGQLAHIFNNVKPDGHAEEVLALVKQAKK